MKKLKLVAVIAILTVLNSNLVYGHSGRTDSNGGHTDKSTGQYHYHNGGSSSSTSSSSSTNTSSTSSTNTSSTTKTTSTPRKIYVSVNGENVSFDTAPFVDNNGRTMVPIAKIAEIFEASTSWDNSTNTVTIQKEDTIITLKIGENKINVNGDIITMDTNAVIKEGRTFVPISAIAKAFNVGYTWNSATSTVEIVK